ncbi:MAG TPA: UvrD-helicase domain-containing protein [Solirubrobacteraceae bacterium]|nr:UvrD-helicase domain-containing protein [Solirubrobacteraceae bacterium]
MSASGHLIDEQRSVLARPIAPLLVSAAAGSGKTRVLVERFVSAVLEEQIAPERLLTITFTVRAAAELRERVAARLGEREGRLQRSRLRGAFIGTFHGFCAMLLREQSFEGALQPGFSVLEEGHAALLRARAYEEALGALVEELSGEQREQLSAYAPEQLQQAILTVYDQLRSRGQRSPALPAPGAGRGGGEEGEGEASAIAALFSRLLELFDERFAAHKQAAGCLDYDDLELCALALLQGDSRLRARWRRRYALIMVDEFQDVNARQLALLRALEDGNLLTVGDEQQSIYGFRHAEVEIFRRRAAALRREGAELTLRTSFRAHPELIETLNALFAQRLGDRHRAMAAGRTETLRAREPAEPRLELLLVDEALARLPWPAGVQQRRGVTRTRLLEAQLLAERIAQLLAQGTCQPAQVAILMRSRTGMAVYRQALEARSIPLASGGESLWGSEATTTLLCHLRSLLNDEEELALSTALASPLCGLSAEALLGIAQLRARLGCSLATALAQAVRSDPAASERRQPQALSERERKRLERYLKERERARAQLCYEGIAATLQRAGELLDEEDQDAVGALVAAARRFERAEGPRVRSFLEYAALAAELPDRAQAPAPATEEGVWLLTIHAAKGLEFDVVCLAELGSAVRLQRPLVLVDGERLGVRIPSHAGKEERSALDYDQLLAERSAREQEESERLLYVACTRARERLILSGCAPFARWPAERPGGAQLHWLAPALLPDLAGALEAAERLVDPLTVPGIAGPVRLRLLGERAAQALEREAPRAGRAEQGRAGPRRGGPPAPSPPQATPSLKELLARRELISYSSLAKLERCALRFYVEDILRLPELSIARGGEAACERERRPGARARGGRALGKILHALIAAPPAERAGAPGPSAVAQLAASAGLGEPSAAECAEIAELARVALSGPLAQRAARAQGARELPFVFVLDPQLPPIGGAFDLYARERDQALVIDYKSDRLREGVSAEDAVRERYSLQRQIYALAALRDGAAAVEVIHWFLRHPEQPAVARYGREQGQQLEAQLRERLDAACALAPAPSPAPNRALCAGCPARGGLCSWDLEATFRAPEATP